MVFHQTSPNKWAASISAQHLIIQRLWIWQRKWCPIQRCKTPFPNYAINCLEWIIWMAFLKCKWTRKPFTDLDEFTRKSTNHLFVLFICGLAGVNWLVKCKIKIQRCLKLQQRLLLKPVSEDLEIKTMVAQIILNNRHHHQTKCERACCVCVLVCLFVFFFWFIKSIPSSRAFRFIS